MKTRENEMTNGTRVARGRGRSMSGLRPAAKLMTGVLAACVAMLPIAAKAASQSIAFFNTSDSDKELPIAQKGPTPLASVTLDLVAPSYVLVQFSSEAALEKIKDGCPCSVRAFLQMDGEVMQPVKRINVGSPAVVETSKYKQDRQELAGSLVFEAPAGRHKFTYIAQQVDGTSSSLIVFYANMQAIAFPK